jgi:hypothetical protein
VVRRSRVSLATGLVAVLLLAGCGVSGSGTPTDEGDAAVVGAATTDSERRNPPVPDSASSPDGLVRDFLRAAVGGGKPGTEQVKRFLNAHALASWVEPVNPDAPQMTVIRLLQPPTTGAVADGRTPVVVNYRIIGTLDRGRVDDLQDSTPEPMTFWVVQDANNPSNLRVDQIDHAVPGLVLSDEALTDGPGALYRIQPVYFWDTSYKLLVPDMRYVPLTDPADVRANSLVQFLADGPSPSLASAVQRLPQGTTAAQLFSDNGTFVVKLSAEAAPGDPDALRRLLFQLQWTLKPAGGTPAIKLVIDDKVQDVPATADEYLGVNRSWNFHVSAQGYDISADQKVVPGPGSGSAPAVLAAGENANVVTAAVGRNGAVAAFVQSLPNNRRSLVLVREGGVINTGLTNRAVIKRPVFLPDSDDSVVVVADNRLYAVSGVDGAAAEIPRAGTSVTSVSVSPDGRRVAYVNNKELFVASLTVANNALGPPRQILKGQISATAVAWTSESWLAVAGEGAALWRVTADGVAAQNISDTLKSVDVTDLVAYPQYPSRPNTDMYATTRQGIYSFVNSLAQEPSLHAPFFGN